MVLSTTKEAGGPLQTRKEMAEDFFLLKVACYSYERFMRKKENKTPEDLNLRERLIHTI